MTSQPIDPIRQPAPQPTPPALPEAPATGRGWRTVLLTAGFGTIMAAADIAQNYGRMVMTDNHPLISSAVAWSVTPWILFALMAPGVIHLTRRYRLGGGAMGTAILMHITFALLFSIAITAGTAVGNAARVESLTFAESFSNILGWYSGKHFILYWVIVGIAHSASYYTDSRERQFATAQLQQMLTRERIDALRTRLNPRFLFETLDAISSMAVEERTEDVAQTTGLLGEMLRMTLDDTLPPEVSLGRELEIAGKYLEIRRIRLGARLMVERNIEPHMLHALVPSMLLQPIVQTSVAHADAEDDTPVVVRIEARRRDSRLLITVRDRGQRLALRDAAGLAATRERLRALYGDDWRLFTAAAADGGAEVSIEIPLRVIA
jgi:two-component system LytT family sensor kinase